MAETKTVYKIFWVWEFEKEERWLNEMAMNGWALKSVGFCRYTFEHTEPGAYTVRLEMRGADEGYLDFMRESGAEYLGRCFQWIYFRKQASLGAFDLFSDIDSRMDHLTRIGTSLRIIGLANLLIGLVNALLSGSGAGAINLLCATLLMYGLGRITGKRDQLEKERELHE